MRDGQPFHILLCEQGTHRRMPNVESTTFVSKDPAPTVRTRDSFQPRVGHTLVKAGDDAPGTHDHRDSCSYIEQDAKRCSKEMCIVLDDQLLNRDREQH
jgi:hypothetical protein